jgi:hypothetical protein
MKKLVRDLYLVHVIFYSCLDLDSRVVVHSLTDFYYIFIKRLQYIYIYIYMISALQTDRRALTRNIIILLIIKLDRARILLFLAEIVSVV